MIQLFRSRAHKYFMNFFLSFEIAEKRLKQISQSDLVYLLVSIRQNVRPLYLAV